MWKTNIKFYRFRGPTTTWPRTIVILSRGSTMPQQNRAINYERLPAGIFSSSVFSRRSWWFSMQIFGFYVSAFNLIQMLPKIIYHKSIPNEILIRQNIKVQRLYHGQFGRKREPLTGELSSLTLYLLLLISGSAPIYIRLSRNYWILSPTVDNWNNRVAHSAFFPRLALF